LDVHLRFIIKPAEKSKQPLLFSSKRQKSFSYCKHNTIPKENKMSFTLFTIQMDKITSYPFSLMVKSSFSWKYISPYSWFPHWL